MGGEARKNVCPYWLVFPQFPFLSVNEMFSVTEKGPDWKGNPEKPRKYQDRSLTSALTSKLPLLHTR